MNPVDEFRNAFFDKLIKEEQEKEKAKIIVQKSCFHNHNIIGPTNHNGYQERTCCKCGHSAIKSVRIWEGTKNGSCIIA
jgi:hypothetical protein